MLMKWPKLDLGVMHTQNVSLIQTEQQIGAVSRSSQSPVAFIVKSEIYLLRTKTPRMHLH